MPKLDFFASAAEVVAILPLAVRAATVASADFDVRKYDGNALLHLDAAAQGSGITTTVTLEASPELAVGGSYLTEGANNIALRHGAADNVLLAASFTQAGARQLKQITLPLKQAGTITAGDIWVTILADDTGPTGSALATSVKIAAASIRADYEFVTFTFATPLALADETVYWVVLQGDYTAGATNQIHWRAATVASGGNASIYDSSWSASDTTSFEFRAWQLNFAEVADFTAVGNAAAAQRLSVPVGGLGPYVRGVVTVAGGSATGGTSLLLIALPQNT
jgi:hypothetical protein